MQELKYEQLEISLHYFIYEKESHQINALIHNYFEFELLTALYRLSELTSYFEIDIRAPKEGGYIEDLILKIFNPENFDFIQNVLFSFLGYFFSKKINKTEDIKNRLEILQKLKEEYEKGKMSKKEIDILIQNDRKLKKAMSEYFKIIDDERRINGVEVTVSSKGTELYTKKIDRTDFQTHYNHVEKDITLDELELVKDARIRIEIPVLSRVSTRKWCGIYHGIKIMFNIEDTFFLDEVHQGNVIFGANTFIECDLEIGYSPSITSDGGLKYSKPHYTVTKVHHVLQ